MRIYTQYVAALAVAAALIANTGCNKLQARDHLNKGVQAFKGAKYNEAVEHFNKSVELDPTFPTARLYLGTAYMNQWIPGADSEENKRFAANAEQEFKRVLDDPASKQGDKSIALASIASIEYNTAKGLPNVEDKLKQMDQARGWYEKLSQTDPENKEAFYSLGVITWEKAYADVAAARSKMGMKPEDPGPLKDAKVRAQLKAEHGEAVQQGIGNLDKALVIDKEYDDAMAYVNLLYRVRADLQDTPAAAKEDVSTADSFVQRSLETKKIKAARAAEAASSGAIIAEPAK